jgi:hypothetical protein
MSMGRHRRYRLPPPPDDAESIVGVGFEFKPEDDLLGQPPNPPLVELTPAGTPVVIIEFQPKDDQASDQPGPSHDETPG